MQDSFGHFEAYSKTRESLCLSVKQESKSLNYSKIREPLRGLFSKTRESEAYSKTRESEALQ